MERCSGRHIRYTLLHGFRVLNPSKVEARVVAATTDDEVTVWLRAALPSRNDDFGWTQLTKMHTYIYINHFYY